MVASRSTFQFSLTEAQYRLSYDLGNSNFKGETAPALHESPRPYAGPLLMQTFLTPFVKGTAKPAFWRNSYWGCVLGLCFYCGACAGVRGEQTNWAAQVRKEFETQQSEYKSKPEDPKAAWQFARSCFDLADFATNKGERANLAQQGIDACRKSLAADSNSAPAYYYLALNQGQLARTRSLGALRLVGQMEGELSKAITLDSHFDNGGPDRTLGLLYRDAPSFGSIGNRSKARQHLERAVELAPDFPENRLCLVESYLKWGETENARREMKLLKEAWPRAHAELTGENWQATWQDWEERLGKVQKRLEQSSKKVD